MHKDYGLNELRETFLKSFETKGHLRLSSLSPIPQNDASLLLINSGMAPMKPWFTGEQEPPCHRVTTCQKCIRTGDIENVGHTTHHDTYFEVLDNFSFGDYFKRDAIHWVREFLTSPEWVDLEANRLYPSVFAGNETTPTDDEVFRIWNEKIGIPAERIFKLGKEDNFWEYGFGLCGPCSEIYYDRGPEWSCSKPGCTVSRDCDRYIEAWNIVFSQFDNDGEGHCTELKQKNIDTGMGLERLACVRQNAVSLFDVDTVINITDKVSEIIHAHYGKTTAKDMPLWVITDHIRSSVFMICDGVLPFNENRGYALRRPLRRAAHHGKLLGVNEPFFYEVYDTVIRKNEDHYFELREWQDHVIKVIRTEEENFAKTIDSGLEISDDILAGHKVKGESTFSGADALKLYSTYGFPIGLTLEVVEEQGMKLDEAELHNQMDEQRQCARKAREALGDLGRVGVEFGKDMPETQFVSYDHAVIDDVRVVALVVGNEQAKELMPGVGAIVVLDKIPFYAEMGGQVAGHDVISADGITSQVTDVQKNKGGKYMHIGKLTQGVLKMDGIVSASVGVKRRKAVMRAHSTTHLLDAAPHQALGGHAYQAGSLVEPDKLRFDFTYFAALTAEELPQVSALVSEAVLEGCGVSTKASPAEEAKQRGAIVLFGEKYGDAVRVVDMGQGFSVGFCGGVHPDNTAEVGVFHIGSEFSMASGVRHIEVTTGLKSLETMNRAQSLLFETAVILKAKPAELREKAEQNMAELRRVCHIVEKFQARETVGEIERFLTGDHDLDELKVLTATLSNADAAKLRQMGDMLRDKQPNVVAVLSTVNDGKIALLAAYGKEAVSKGVKAGDIVKNVTTICGGKGGDKSDSAMGGRNDLLKLGDTLAKVDDLVAEKLGL